MPPRSDDPRRDATTGSRRGSSRGGEPGGGGISDARAYTPRGRTIRESDEAGAERAGQRRNPRASRSGDPFRPALQVLDGGRAGSARAGRRNATAAGRGGVVRTVQARPVRPDDDEHPPPPRRRPGRAPRRP
ncbi:penicillin-binding protein 2, partial [Micromonospora sp. KC606]